MQHLFQLQAKEHTICDDRIIDSLTQTYYFLSFDPLNLVSGLPLVKLLAL